MANASAPIGIFDSGIGGLTVANALVKHLPDEEIFYFGDTAHLPYGDKSADAIRYYSLKIVKFLLEQQCKLIVIACNSASSTSYKVLQEFFGKQTLFVEVVAPLVRAVAQSDAKKAGIIATKATVSSGVYEDQLRTLRPDMAVTSLATPLLVPMIEEGFVHNKISDLVLHQYLSQPELKDIDALMLACTHYPLLRAEIEAFYKGKIAIFDSTDVVAAEVYQTLRKHQLLNEQRRKPHHFFVSDLTDSFTQTARSFYQHDVHLEHCPIW